MTKKFSTTIRRDIRDHKADMKANGLKVTSFMNGGQTITQMRANERLFALKTQLEIALKQETGNATSAR